MNSNGAAVSWPPCADAVPADPNPRLTPEESGSLVTTSRTLTTIRTPRRTALGIGAGLGLGAVMAACSSGTGAQSLASPTSGGLVLGLTYTPNIQFAPFYLALSRGEYAPAVSLRHHGEQEG